MRTYLNIAKPLLRKVGRQPQYVRAVPVASTPPRVANFFLGEPFRADFPAIMALKDWIPVDEMESPECPTLGTVLMISSFNYGGKDQVLNEL